MVAVLLLTVAFSGCIGSNGELQRLAEAVECMDASGVDNQVASFAYGGAVACKDEVETYGWENPGPRASVEWGGAVGNGTLDVTIMDGLDRVVYEATIDGGAGGQSGTTDMGVPGPSGQWTVELTFSNFTGTMGLSIETA